MQKICVMHLNQIGDFVFSLPLLKALRDKYPKAEIHSVARQYLGELFETVGFVDRVIFRQTGFEQKLSLCRQIRQASYDLLINLSRSEECFVLTALSRAKQKAGFARFAFDICLDVKEEIEGHNSWHNNRKLLRRLNVPFDKDDYVGLIGVHGAETGLNLPERFTVVSPGASRRRRSAKAWPEEMFAALLVRLSAEQGLSPVLVGSADDTDVNRHILAMYHDRKPSGGDDGIDLSGSIGLKALCGVLSRCALFVGIDSGVMHLASCVDVPVVGLFGPSDPCYVGPQNPKSIVVRSSAVDCMPCYFKPCSHINCMKTLDQETVFKACETLLSRYATEKSKPGR